LGEQGKIISGIQQIGIGVPDVPQAWAWYRKNFGMDVPIFQEEAEAKLMIDYTGNEVHKRNAVLAINMQGGGGFEIWQFTSRLPEPANFEIKFGDYGIYAAKMKVVNVDALHKKYKTDQLELLSEVMKDPEGKKHFFVKDLYGNIFQMEEADGWFDRNSYSTGGASGAIIGVSDIDAALKVYRDILEYDEIVYDETGIFEDFGNLNGGKRKARRIKLKHTSLRKGSFSKLLGPTTIELVALTEEKGTKIYKDRYWGDLGFIHICFDIRHMDSLRSECELKGFPFTVDSQNSFDMGEAAGHFSYIADPDGTLIEFVETHKIPIMKKMGWYLNLKNRNPEKSLPTWLIKALRFNRVKD
jgi:catechol 2,3-dioxygenase-like lactoylglutathione lyase family enzyme